MMGSGQFSFKSVLLLSILTAGCSSTVKMDQGQRMASELFLSYNQVVDPSSFKRTYPGWRCESAKKKLAASTSFGGLWREQVARLNTCVAEQKWDLVEEMASQLLESDPRSPWGPFYLSLAAQGKGALEKALWRIQLAEKKTPGVGLFEFQRARILFQMGELNQAIRAAEVALSKDSTLISAEVFLGDLFFQIEDFDAAKRHFAVALKHDSERADLNLKMGEIHFKDGNLKEARIFFEQALRRGSKETYLYFRLGILLKDHFKEPSEALRVFKQGQQLEKQKQTGLESTYPFSEHIKELEQLVAKGEQDSLNGQREPARADGERLK